MANTSVFISYSHDSSEHRTHVLALANKLRNNGIDAELDQYINGTPREGWPNWMVRVIREVNFVLVVCTPTYYRRVMGMEDKGVGKGVKWEAQLTLQEIYDNDSNNPKFIPVLFADGLYDYIPEPLRAVTAYTIETSDGYENLCRYLTNQPRVIKPPLGIPLKLPVHDIYADSPPSSTEIKSKRFFIAYCQSDISGRELAIFLHSALTDVGNEVFIDQEIVVGSNWVEAIDQGIANADCMVVLLCEEAMDSEAVHSEVRLAYNAGKTIVPVRVDYAGQLDYELEIFLGHLQYIAWRGPSDSDTVAQAVMQAALSNEAHKRSPAEWQHDAQGARTINDPRKPQTAADPRPAYVPDGKIKPAEPYYLNRDADQQVIDLANSNGETLVIKAPHQMGKSSLLMQYLQACRNNGKRIVLLDFDILSEEDFVNYPTFLTRVLEVFHRALRIDGKNMPKIERQSQATWYIEDHILSAVDGPLVLAFDETDRLLGRPYQADFFSMLRLWHNSRGNFDPLWEEVDLALVISTEPYLLIDDDVRSPFNVGCNLTLSPFSIEQYKQLNFTMQAQLSDSELTQLHQLVGGHPYLTRLAFYQLTKVNAPSFIVFIQSAPDEQGPFGGHLRSLKGLLYRRDDLLPALRRVIRGDEHLEDNLYYRLFGVGLVRRTEGKVKPANLLYARFFKGSL